MTQTLRLACFDVGTDDLRWWAPAILDRYPDGFFSLHQRLFRQVCDLSQPADLGGVALGQVEVWRYEPCKNHYPSDDDLAQLDGIVISGSAHGAYDAEDWVVDLRSRLLDYHQRRIRLSGFSFGPQILAQALGGQVGPNPLGSELSVVTVHLTAAAQRYFGCDRPSYRIHVHHNDGILQLPPGAVSLGGSPVTETLGWMLGDHILAFSGHPDYSSDPWVLEQLMQVEREQHLLPAQLVDYGLRDLWTATDYIWQTQQQLRFFLGQLSLPALGDTHPPEQADA
jgi:GMP synthase-like glutamine amidotransferase